MTYLGWSLHLPLILGIVGSHESNLHSPSFPAERLRWLGMRVSLLSCQLGEAVCMYKLQISLSELKGI